MRKHLTAACLVVAAFAVLPSLASAKPVITHPTGTVLATGTKITATNVGNIVLSNGLGNITCSTATTTGELTVNNTANGFEADITSLKMGGTTGKTIAGDEEPECTGTGFYAGGIGVTSVPPYCLEATEANDTFKMRGGLCTAAATAVKIKYSVTTIFGTVPCEYQKTSITGTIETDITGQDALLNMSEQEFTKTAGSSGECPASNKLSMGFTLETDTPTPSPIYISS